MKNLLYNLSMHQVLWALFICLAFNLLLFIPAYKYQTDKLTDLSYSLTFIIVAIFSFSLSDKNPAQMVALLMVLMWALRLGGFLFIRINKMKKDRRFDEMRGRWQAFLRFWFFQGLTVFVVLAAALGLWSGHSDRVNAVSYAGFIVFGLGLVLEAMSDWQKYRFNQVKTKDIWIDTGFWRISRHPNYLGEIMVWAGVYLFCYASLSGPARVLGLASPVYITLILLFFSGIPLLEKGADKKWGADRQYRNYKKDVPLLIPTLSSLKRL